MSKPILYILDKAVAERIKSYGFSYNTRKFGDAEVYEFISSLGLLAVLRDYFSDTEVIKSKYMVFGE